MKTSNEFIMREIAGEYVLVPIGKRALTFQGLVTMNEVGALIWEMMEKESDIDQIDHRRLIADHALAVLRKEGMK